MAYRDEIEMHLLLRINYAYQHTYQTNYAYQLALKVEAKLARGCVKKLVEICSLYPSSKGETSHGEGTSSNLECY
jgi:hypothetical protein